MRVGECLQRVPYTPWLFGRAPKAAVEQGLGANSPTSPEIKPEEVEGKTKEELEKLAKDKGLIEDPNKPGKWRDPATGKERLLIHDGHVDVNTGQPYDNERAAAPHAHAFDQNRKPIGDPSANGDLHFPIKPSN
jgi:hypothetical protein